MVEKGVRVKGFNRKEHKEVSQGSQRVGGKRVLTAKGRKGLASKTVSIP
jgi:hypothetical protein